MTINYYIKNLRFILVYLFKIIFKGNNNLTILPCFRSLKTLDSLFSSFPTLVFFFFLLVLNRKRYYRFFLSIFKLILTYKGDNNILIIIMM